MKYKIYEVGGKVRDEIMGLYSNDIDYTVVLEEGEFETMNEYFNAFSKLLKEEGYSIFLESPDVLTIRAKFPKGHQHEGIVADFVLARKEVFYPENSRTPVVEVGTLMDDLERRDFTVNAIAKNIDGKLIDPFEGIEDIKDKILRTPKDAFLSFNDDPLRIIRALRFKITKGFEFSDNIIQALTLMDVNKMDTISDDRIRQELNKMFKFDTSKSLDILFWLKGINSKLFENIFSRDLWLMATNKQ